MTHNRWMCETKSYDELKAEMEAGQQQMVKAKKNERANALKKVKRLCKEFSFTTAILNDSLAEGRKMISKILFLFERVAAYLLGKGWGSAAVEKEFSAALSLLKQNKVNLCVDIGGNKGTYTEQIIEKAPDCNVVIFEPAETNVEQLRRKFSEVPNVKIEPCAVSNVVGDATLYSNEDGSGLASLTQRRLDHFGIDFDNTESIKTIKFEDYWKVELKSQNIDICKIDIEGHELDALAGFGEAIMHISVIQFEFGGSNIDTRTFFQDFWYFFQEHKFELYRISPIGLIHIPRYRELDEFFITTNYLAKRK